MQSIVLRLAIYYPDYPTLGDQLRPADLLLALSIRYGWFFICALMQLSAGGKLVLLPRTGRASDLMRAIASWDQALVCVTANMCRAFIAAAPAGGFLFPRLYLLESGGLPLFAEEKRAALAHVAPNFRESYGTASIGAISVLGSGDMLLKPDSVGRPLPMIDLQIVDAAGNQVAGGAFGAIRCRGALMPRPCPEDDGEQRSEYFRGGWFYTGDVGMLDHDGYLHLRGRIADVIRRGASEVYASEIEAALALHPGVAEAAVLGLPTPAAWHEIVAFVVRRNGGLTHDALAAHCRAQLAPERRPDRIYYTDALPRLGGGKIDRLRLLEVAAQRASGSGSGG
jgi:acyl-coenzyme A synthetase/AMP-(fatty) acid ligase